MENAWFGVKDWREFDLFFTLEPVFERVQTRFQASTGFPGWLVSEDPRMIYQSFFPQETNQQIRYTEYGRT